MAPTPSSADALVRRRRGFELIKQNAGRLSGEAYSANRRMLTTFKKYSDPGIYHRWVVGALENVGTDAVPEVADLLRVMKDAHPKSGAIMLERIGAGLRDGTASGGKTVGPAGREVDREELIAGLTDHFHGTRPEPEQEVSRDRLTTAPRRAGPAVGSKPILDSYGRDLLRVSDDEAVPPAEGRAGGAPPLSSFGPGVQGRPLALGTPPPDRPATSRQSGLFHQASAAPAVTKPAVRQSGLPGETAKQPVHQAGEPSGLLKQASAHVTKEELDRIEEKYRELIPLADLRGHKFAKANLEYWFSRKGGTRQIPIDQIRAFGEVQAAELVNQERFDRDWLNTSSDAHAALRSLLTLPEGTPVIVRPKSKKGEEYEKKEPRWDRLIEDPKSEDLRFGRGLQRNVDII